MESQDNISWSVVIGVPWTQSTVGSIQLELCLCEIRTQVEEQDVEIIIQDCNVPSETPDTHVVPPLAVFLILLTLQEQRNLFLRELKQFCVGAQELGDVGHFVFQIVGFLLKVLNIALQHRAS
ncbi:hypothetical protein FKM82_008712 [Ascaphus truei]